MSTRFFHLSLLLTCLLPVSAKAQSLKAPPGVFKDLDDSTVGDALILEGKQLFIDDHIIATTEGLTKVLHQPTKHPKNPVLVKDKPWEESGPGYATVYYDKDEKLFKMWYTYWRKVEGTSTSMLAYATSPDGIAWTKPIVDEKGQTNLLRQPAIQGFQCPGVFKDHNEPDPARRYKMLFSCNPDGTSKTWMTSAAFSADGLNWELVKPSALIPFSDTQICPFWDSRRGRYVAIMRFGPPNTRIIARTESTDFLHWSPKVTVFRRTIMDEVQQTQFYQMAPVPYGNIYLGLIGTYHNESLKPISADKPWTDRQDLQLAFSRDGIIWKRVGGNGAVTHAELNKEQDWSSATREAVFLPYGKKDKDWDWGTITPYYTPEPIIVDDRVYFYYSGSNAKHWWTWSGDPPKLDPDAIPPENGVGLATLRLDGFVSVETAAEGTLTTRPLLFLGDTLVVNADATDGEIQVEAVDPEGNVIEGFSRDDCAVITTDSVRHVVTWKENPDCHLLQGRPIQLRFFLKQAKLYSLEATNRHNHYLQSYK
jgi:hypothetical protein